MTRQLALIVVLAFNQTLHAALDHPNPPESNQAPKAETAPQADDLNAPSQIAIPALDAHVYAQKTEPGPNSNGETQEDANQRETNRPVSIAEKDLIAQESMARSAYWMTFLAFTQLFGSGVGIYLLWHTLKSTRQAAQAAVDSARAAKEAIASDRAYMTIDHHFPEEHTSGMFKIMVTWLNSGRTPAIIKSMRFHYEAAAPTDARPKPDYPTAITTDMKLGPGQKTLYPIDVSDSHAIRTEIIDRKRIIYIFSKVEYEDIFEAGVTKSEEVAVIVEPATDRAGLNKLERNSWGEGRIFSERCVYQESFPKNTPGRPSQQ